MNTNLEVLFNCLYFQVIQYLISDPDHDPVYLIDEKNWRQFSDEMELRRLCMLELEKNPTAVRFHWINHRLKYQVSEWLNCSLNWKYFFIQTVICSAFYPIHINWAPGPILKIFLLPLYFTAFQGQVKCIMYNTSPLYRIWTHMEIISAAAVSLCSLPKPTIRECNKCSAK